MGKYDHLILPCGEIKEKLEIGPWITIVDSQRMPGSNYYAMHWIMPGHHHPDPVGHPPHLHQEDELMFHIGTNPDDPTELGAEVEFYIGEEMERHVITKSCVVFIPGGLIHSPWTVTKCEKPWIWIGVQQATQRTEKFFPELCDKALRDAIDWSHWKDDHM